MTSDKVEDVLFMTAIVVFCVFMLWLFAMLVSQSSAQKVCLAQGWPEAKTDYLLTQYCVRRVNQTDIVVRTSTLRP